MKEYPLPDWPFGLGAPEISGRMRVELDDFRVQEIPLFSPEGEGNHLWLEVEKRGANTHWVAGQLASAAGIPERDMGYAGLKDRHGVTSQWFSVGLQEADNADWESWEIPDVRFLQARKHSRKLKRGALRGNRFQIVVRAIEGDPSGLAERLALIRQHGVPNYFGLQRFGNNGANLPRAVQWLQHGGRITRNKRSIFISSLRSFLFNEVTARRVDQGSWNSLLDGEIAMLNGSHSVFTCSLPDPDLSQRCETLDIHPSGPLPGSGGKRPEREALTVENEALAEHGEMVSGLERIGARADRRSLRLIPEDLQSDLEGDALTLSFSLPAGNYATSLLRELVTCTDDGHIPEP